MEPLCVRPTAAREGGEIVRRTVAIAILLSAAVAFAATYFLQVQSDAMTAAQFECLRALVAEELAEVLPADAEAAVVAREVGLTEADVDDALAQSRVSRTRAEALKLLDCVREP